VVWVNRDPVAQTAGSTRAGLGPAEASASSSTGRGATRTPVLLHSPRRTGRLRDVRRGGRDRPTGSDSGADRRPEPDAGPGAGRGTPPGPHGFAGCGRGSRPPAGRRRQKTRASAGPGQEAAGAIFNPAALRRCPPSGAARSLQPVPGAPGPAPGRANRPEAGLCLGGGATQQSLLGLLAGIPDPRGRHGQASLRGMWPPIGLPGSCRFITTGYRPSKLPLAVG